MVSLVKGIPGFLVVATVVGADVVVLVVVVVVDDVVDTTATGDVAKDVCVLDH